MTDIVYAIIDNHKKKKGTNYNFLYRTKKFEEFMEYVNRKGLVNTDGTF